MSQDVPIPAEAARQLAIEASQKIDYHRDEGRKATARRLEEQTGEVLSSLNGQDGEFVSIDGSIISSLAAEASIEARAYSDCARVFLEQYDVW